MTARERLREILLQALEEATAETVRRLLAEREAEQAARREHDHEPLEAA